MATETENITLVVEGTNSTLPPLILMHAAGGTTFHYHLLEPLNRDIYGIARPDFDDFAPWSGDFHSMAETYCGFIRDALPPGPIILGGWSMGGMLAFEMAHIFATAPSSSSPSDSSPDHDQHHHKAEDERSFHVLGLLFLDSQNPTSVPRSFLEPWGPDFSDPDAPTSPEMRAKVQAVMRDGRRLIAGWELPDWKGTEAGKPPAGVLLKAAENVPVLASTSASDGGRDEDGGGNGDGDREGKGMRKSGVDFLRDRRMLGWEDYGFEFLKEVKIISGHHYSLFHWDYLEDLSTVIGKSCDELVEYAEEESRKTG